MLQGPFFFLSCICGNHRKPRGSPPQELPGEGVKQQEHGQLHSSHRLASSDGQPVNCGTSYDVQALLRLQRALGGLRGTWLPRTQAVLSTICVFLDATDASFFGASGSGKAHGTPASFVLLATESLNSFPAPKTGHSTPLPGFEVWPANERVKFDGQGRKDDVTVPSVATLGLQSQEACQRLMPFMLDRMLATQAPIIQPIPYDNQAGPAGAGAAMSIPSDRDCGLVALVPLTVGDYIAGALWLVRCAAGSAAPLASPDVPKPGTPSAFTRPQHPGSVAYAVGVDDSASLPSGLTGGSTMAGKAAAEASSARFPTLLANPQALQQLGLSASMCLLGSEAGLLAGLADSLRTLAAAGCMKQLVSGLCEALGGHMQERYLLEPRLFAALVPEPASAVGLMFNHQPPAACVTPVMSRSAPREQRISPMGSGGAAGGGGEAANMGESRRDGRPQSPCAATAGGIVVTLGYKEVPSPGPQSKSESTSRWAGAAGPAAATGGDVSGGNAAQERDGGLQQPRTARLPRVLALSQTDLEHVATAAGGCPIGAASGSFVALRVKPFPMTQTLLRCVVRKVAFAAATAPAALPTGPGGGSGGGATLSPAASSCRSPGGRFRARAIEVVDVASHLQDPKKPSRDILLLITNSGTRSAQPLILGGGAGGGGGGGVVPAYVLASTSGGGGGSGNGLCSSAGGGSFTSSRRGVSSLLLLVLPAGDGKAMLGLYVTFPQQLPQQLLRKARTDLLEILEVLSPVVSRKLTVDLAVELDTLTTAAPGSYAVLEAPEVDDCGPLDDVSAAAGGPPRPAGPKSMHIHPPGPDIAAGGAGGRLLPIYSPLVQSFLYDSWGGGGTGSGMVGVGGIGGLGGITAPGQSRSMNLMDTLPGAHVVAGENTGGMASLLSVRDSALVPHSNQPGMTMGGENLTRSTVIHLEELDMVQSTIRAQMPLLVASMQSSISTARAEAALAAAAASINRGGGSFAMSSPLAFGADPGDLAQLELHTQLGHGGCAVVFKGRLGTLDCAIKLMEMPDVDGTDANGDAEKRPGGADGGDSPDDSEGGARRSSGGGGSDDSGGLAARRAMLRNAMELAAMTCISHPNVMQVFSTFSNVTLGRRTHNDGTERFFLKAVDADFNSLPESPPICIAIVCEWCDKGCLGNALKKRLFPALLPASALSSARKVASGGGGGCASGSGGRQLRALCYDFKGILMTLLDVAMALRHLHSHHLIHRDVKPANVLLKGNAIDPRGFTAKLADFGFVTLLNQPGDEKSGGEPFVYVDETCGTVTHMAPECWSKPTRLDASCDVYSFGILMWEMTAGGLRPYPEIHPKNIARVVKRGQRPTFEEGVPLQYRFLAQRCWTADPRSRPRTSELVAGISQMLGRM